MLHLALPPSCRPWLPALAWYLRQNLLIFLHSPKYTDSNSRNHFQVRLHPQSTPTCVLAEEAVFYRSPPVYLCAPVDLCTPSPGPALVTYLYLPLLLRVPVPRSPCGHPFPEACVHLAGLSARWLFSPQHPLPPQGGLPDLDIYLYNKPGGQGTGGKGTVQPLGPWRRGVWESLFLSCSWMGWGGAGPRSLRAELSFWISTQGSPASL